MMPLRKTPEVSSTIATSHIKGLVKTFCSNCNDVNSMCICPDEASAVSRCGKFASSGVSLISHKSITDQKIMMAAGIKNTDHVASSDSFFEAHSVRISE